MKKTYEIKITKEQFNQLPTFSTIVDEYEYKDEHHILTIREFATGFKAVLERYHGEAYKYGALMEIDRHYSELHDMTRTSYDAVIGEYKINHEDIEIIINIK